MKSLAPILLSVLLQPCLANSASPLFELNLGDLPEGKAIIVSHAVTVDSPAAANVISSQATVSGTNFGPVASDDPATAAAGDVTMTDVQLPPAVSDLAIAVTEDTARALALNEFESAYSDGNNDPLQVVRILSLPGKGSLELDGTPLVGTPVDVPRADVDKLVYSPGADLNGPDSFGWTASDGVDFSASTASVNLAIAAVNDPPVAAADTVTRFAGQTLKIPVSSLLANDSDVEEGALTLTTVSSSAANGGTVTLGGATIFYQPNGHTGADTFTYTVADPEGLTAQGSVTIGIREADETGGNAQNLVNMERLGDGSLQAIFAGIPGRSYRIQSTETLGDDSWVDRGTVTAGSDGRIPFVDPPPLPTTRFYRTVHP